MSERERMLSGELYYSPDQELAQMHIKCHEILDEFNQTKFNDFRTREILAHKLFKSVGENCFINKPFLLRLWSEYHCREKLLREFQLHNS
ncbi:MAG: maltose acetyltransferase domain-containing protein [Candidatus Izemoplasmatales bacterium]|nr:maltose acetyltransferase domain-containing protein [Candidatus Izemoplasmatales bacterium]